MGCQKVNTYPVRSTYSTSWSSRSWVFVADARPQSIGLGFRDLTCGLPEAGSRLELVMERLRAPDADGVPAPELPPLDIFEPCAAVPFLLVGAASL